jgi:hypothetical protein
MKRKVHDHEISPWQNNPTGGPTIRSDAERESRAQSRKRRQVRNAEAEAKLWPLHLLIIIIVFGFMAYIAAQH